jgi:hypothetical protein
MSIIRSNQTSSVFSARAWCPKCMSSVYLYQPKPMTDPLLMKCEVCGTIQNAVSTELRTACIGENTNLKEIRRSRRK